LVWAFQILIDVVAMNTILLADSARNQTAGTDFSKNRLIFDANHLGYFMGAVCDAGDV